MYEMEKSEMQTIYRPSYFFLNAASRKLIVSVCTILLFSLESKNFNPTEFLFLHITYC